MTLLLSDTELPGPALGERLWRGNGEAGSRAAFGERLMESMAAGMLQAPVCAGPSNGTWLRRALGTPSEEQLSQQHWKPLISWGSGPGLPQEGSVLRGSAASGAAVPPGHKLPGGQDLSVLRSAPPFLEHCQAGVRGPSVGSGPSCPRGGGREVGAALSHMYPFSKCIEHPLCCKHPAVPADTAGKIFHSFKERQHRDFKNRLALDRIKELQEL